MQMIPFEPQLWSWLTPAVVGLGLVVAFLAMLAWLTSWRSSKIAHIERMRAMELGYILPERASRWAPAFYCVGVGGGVPIATFLITLFATLNQRVDLDIWIAPIVVSGLAVIGSTVVAGIAFSRSDRSTQPDKLFSASGKPTADVESLDFGGRVGHG